MGTDVPFSLYSRVFGNNFNKNVEPQDDTGYSIWTRLIYLMNCKKFMFRSPLDAFILVLTNFLPLGSQRMFTLISSIRLLCRSTFDNIIKSVIGRLFGKLFEEERLIYLITLTEQSLFCPELVTATEQEKVLREELAKKKVEEFVQDEVMTFCYFHSIQFRFPRI